MIKKMYSGLLIVLMSLLTSSVYTLSVQEISSMIDKKQRELNELNNEFIQNVALGAKHQKYKDTKFDVDSKRVEITVLEKQKPPPQQKIADSKQQLKDLEKIFTGYKNDWEPYKNKHEGLIDSLKKLRQQLQEARHAAIPQQKIEAERIRIKAEERVIEQSRKTAPEMRGADPGPPLTYGISVALRCRGVGGNNLYKWPYAFTVSDHPTWNAQLPERSSYEIVVLSKYGVDPGKPHARSWKGGQYLMLRKAGDPTYLGPVLSGDTVEILSLYATKGHVEQALGTGRKWWVSTEVLSWFGNYPHINVGPNDDSERVYYDKKLPLSELGYEQFVIELTGKSTGQPLHEGDRVKIKTSQKNPELPGKYVWLKSHHEQWGSQYSQLCVAGPKGADYLGLETIKKDRSLSIRNEFAFEFGRPIGGGPSYDESKILTPAYLPQGSVISLRSEESNKFVGMVNDELQATFDSDHGPATQFEVYYQKNGWLGLRNVVTKKFLDASLKTKYDVDYFTPQKSAFMHWSLGGSALRAYLKNQNSDSFLAFTGSKGVNSRTRQKNTFLSINIISRPTASNAAPIQINHAKYGNIDVALSLQKLIDSRGGREVYLAPSMIKSALGVPATAQGPFLDFSYTIGKNPRRWFTQRLARPLNIVSFGTGKLKRFNKLDGEPVKKLVVKPKIVKPHVRIRNRKQATVAPAKPVAVLAEKPAPSVDKTHALTLKNNNRKVVWLTNHKFRLPKRGSGYLTFDMNASRDAYFTFDAKPNADTVSEAALALHLGGVNNTRTDILEKGKVIKSYTKKDAMIVPNKKHYYWIGFAHGKLMFGSNTHPGDKPVFVFSNEHADKVRYIGVSNADARVALSVIKAVPLRKEKPREVVQKVHVGYGYPRRGGIRSRRYSRRR